MSSTEHRTNVWVRHRSSTLSGCFVNRLRLQGEVLWPRCSTFKVECQAEEKDDDSPLPANAAMLRRPHDWLKIAGDYGPYKLLH